MKGIELDLVNGISGDPAVHATFSRTGEAVLLDLGSIDRLSNRELLKIRLALVSHAHVDHFIGFDHWLRVHVPHFRPLTVVGPSGMIEHVQGKLRGYLWNLLEDDQLVFDVTEVSFEGGVRSVRISNTDGFRAHPLDAPKVPPPLALDAPLPTAPAVAVFGLDDGTRFEALALDHGTPSLAFACQAPCRLQTDVSAIAALGLEPGSWLRELQLAVAERRKEVSFDFGAAGRFSAEMLAGHIFTQNLRRPFAYVTDIGFTRQNLERLVPFLRGVDTLVCETNYRHADRVRASANMHLTTYQAALIAAAAGVKVLTTFHVSNVYAQNPLQSVSEAAEFFASFRTLDAHDLAAKIAAELAACEADRAATGRF